MKSFGKPPHSAHISGLSLDSRPRSAYGDDGDLLILLAKQGCRFYESVKSFAGNYSSDEKEVIGLV
jgi:hypothetical protein